LCLTADNEIFACGQNIYGQLGQGDTDVRTKFSLVRSMIEVKVLTVESGPDASCVITTDYEVWVFGNVNYGKLGID